MDGVWSVAFWMWCFGFAIAFLPFSGSDEFCEVLVGLAELRLMLVVNHLHRLTLIERGHNR
jgi:hypothetical protein